MRSLPDAYAYSIDSQYELILSNILFLQREIRKKHKDAILFVEGYTDFVFYKDKIQDNVELIDIQHLIDGVSPMQQSDYIRNCDVIKRFLNWVYTDADSPKRIKPECYGIVDRDYGIEEDDLSIDNLFITETHDLETMLLSTDVNVLNELNIGITAEQLDNAKLLAYELADIRELIYRFTDFKHKNLNEQNRTVDFSKFIEKETGELSLRLVLERLNSQRAKSLPLGDVSNILERLIQQCGNKVDVYGVYKLRNNPLLTLVMEGIWVKANGHDVCSAIMYLNKNAKNKYNPDSEKRYRCSMELDIIDKYNKSCFTQTDLYQCLMDSALILNLSGR